MTKIGIMAWAGAQHPIGQIGDVARVAEQYGFHTLWLWDTPLYTKDAYVGLTVAAAATQKLLLGPGVSNALTRHLSISVNAISTLDDPERGQGDPGDGAGSAGLGQRSRVRHANPGPVPRKPEKTPCPSAG